MLTNINISKHCYPNSSELLQTGCGIFPEFSPRYTEAKTTLFNPPNSCSDTCITKHALEAMMLGFIQVTEKQQTFCHVNLVQNHRLWKELK